MCYDKVHNERNTMKPTLVKAAKEMSAVCDALRDSLNNANHVQGIVLLSLIGKANKLRRDIEDLRIAYQSDTKPE